MYDPTFRRKELSYFPSSIIWSRVRPPKLAERRRAFLFLIVCVFVSAKRVSSYLFDHTNDAAGSGDVTVYSNDFSTSYTSFTATGTTLLSITSGKLKAGGMSSGDIVRLTLSTVAGKNYRVTFDIDPASSVSVALKASDYGTVWTLASSTASTAGRYSYLFIAQSAATMIQFQHSNSTPVDLYLDNFLVEDVSPSGVYSQRLNGSSNEKFGLARSLSVMPGDVINMEVFAKYVDPNPANRTAFLNNLLIQVASGTLTAWVADGVNYSTSTSSFPFPGLLSTAGSTGGPKAYLNWLIFDRNFVFLNGGYKRLSATPKENGQNVAHELLSANVTITQPGYVYVFLSNEETTPVEVYFDDFKVEHVKSPVIQSQDYYPFGLTFNSYNRENSVEV